MQFQLHNAGQSKTHKTTDSDVQSEFPACDIMEFTTKIIDGLCVFTSCAHTERQFQACHPDLVPAGSSTSDVDALLYKVNKDIRLHNPAERDVNRFQVRTWSVGAVMAGGG